MMLFTTASLCGEISSGFFPYPKTAIQGAADPVTTGGHVDTAGRRMISNYGLEDCCGALWQWIQGVFYNASSSNWEADPSGKGSVYRCNALLAGGNWDSSTNCGSRARAANDSRLAVYSYYGCRGRARSRV